METFLISPPGNMFLRSYSMSESGYLAAALRQDDLSVRIIDGELTPLSQIDGLIRQTDGPVLVLLVLQWDHDVHGPWLHEIMALLRTRGQSVHLGVGGKMATVYHRYLFAQFPAIDSILLGEADGTVVDLARCLASGMDWRQVRGLAYSTTQGTVRTAPRMALHDLDSLPLPARDYLDEHQHAYPAVPILTSRSCYGRCGFCRDIIHRHASLKGRYVARSVQNVVEEIERLADGYGASFFDFCDDSFVGPGRKGKERAREIAEEIIRRGLRIRFQISCRANDVEREVFLALKQAGLRNVLIGIESGVQAFLDRYQKDTTVEENRKALRITRELGINCDVLFIMYDPEITFEELKENLAFIREMELHRYMSSTSLFSRLTLLPGSAAEARFCRLRGIAPPVTPICENYTIADERVAMIERLHRAYREEMRRRQAVYLSLVPGNYRGALSGSGLLDATQRMIHPTADPLPSFQVALARWRETLRELGVRILARMVGLVDARQETSIAALVPLLLQVIQDQVERHQLRLFGRSFGEMVQTAQGWSCSQEELASIVKGGRYHPAMALGDPSRRVDPISSSVKHKEKKK